MTFLPCAVQYAGLKTTNNNDDIFLHNHNTITTSTKNNENSLINTNTQFLLNFTTSQKCQFDQTKIQPSTAFCFSFAYVS